jgi:predicted transposase/invertase (TIGR01784 family)
MSNTLIRFDWAIKRLLRNKANFVILEGFLSELLKEDIHIVEILESESNMQDAGNKLTRVDLLVKNATGELVIIEVQNSYKHDYLLRILFGVAKLIVDNMGKRMDYSNVKKVISVNIVYFNFGQGEDYIYRGSTNYVGMYKEDILALSDHEKIVFKAERIDKIYPEFYIIKVNNFNNVAKNTLDEWVNFLKTEEVKVGSQAKGLTEAKEEIEMLKLDKAAMAEYDREVEAWRDYSSDMSTHFMAGKLEGIEQGKQQGIQQGILDGKLAIARNCIEEGMTIIQISKITGLPHEILIKYLDELG